jgi:hypothetical protein
VSKYMRVRSPSLVHCFVKINGQLKVI